MIVILKVKPMQFPTNIGCIISYDIPSVWQPPVRFIFALFSQSSIVKEYETRYFGLHPNNRGL
jgi:hypothetical protein